MSWGQRALDVVLHPFGYESARIEDQQSAKDELYRNAWPDSAAITAAGTFIGPDTAMRISTVNACISILAGSVASLPLKVFRRIGDDGQKEEVPNDPRGIMLSRRTNPWQVAVAHREQTMTKLPMRGNAYSVKVLVRGKASELWPIEPRRVEVRQTAGGSLRYKVQPDSSSPVATTGRVYDQDEILHLRGISTDGISGRSVIGDARQTYGLGSAQERFGARVYGKGAHFSGVMIHPGKLSAKARENIERSFDRNEAGLNNSHKMLLLQEGMTWTNSSMSAEDAQFLEARKFQIEDIARFFLMPPSMLGATGAMPRSNVEEESRRFVVFTLRPWLVRIEAQYNADLFDPIKESDLFLEHNVAGLLRGDLKARYQAYRVATAGQPWLSINEVRKLENRNPVKDGDEIKEPLNMTSLGGGSDNDREEDE